jgi:arylsulfatase A-like enzyme
MNQPRSLFETNLLSVFGQSLSTQARVTNYLELLAEANRFATDARIGLTFIHFQPPHGPHSYNRFTKKFDLGNSPIGGYLDSLALADRSLGDFRRSLEEAGLWDQTTILVSSDHWYRTALELDGKFDRRVPFLLKFAGQKEGMVYDPVFNTLGSSELLLSVLRGDIKDIGGVSRWLDGHKNYTTNPYIFLEK